MRNLACVVCFVCSIIMCESEIDERTAYTKLGQLLNDIEENRYNFTQNEIEQCKKNSIYDCMEREINLKKSDTLILNCKIKGFLLEEHVIGKTNDHFLFVSETRNVGIKLTIEHKSKEIKCVQQLCPDLDSALFVELHEHKIITVLVTKILKELIEKHPNWADTAFMVRIAALGHEPAPETIDTISKYVKRLLPVKKCYPFGELCIDVKSFNITSCTTLDVKIHVPGSHSTGAYEMYYQNNDWHVGNYFYYGTRHWSQNYLGCVDSL